LQSIEQGGDRAAKSHDHVVGIVVGNAMRATVGGVARKRRALFLSHDNAAQGHVQHVHRGAAHLAQTCGAPARQHRRQAGERTALSRGEPVMDELGRFGVVPWQGGCTQVDLGRLGHEQVQFVLYAGGVDRGGPHPAH
jgi:hypothetical protein